MQRLEQTSLRGHSLLMLQLEFRPEQCFDLPEHSCRQMVGRGNYIVDSELM